MLMGERKHKTSLDIGQYKGGKVHCNTLLSPMRQQLCMIGRERQKGLCGESGGLGPRVRAPLFFFRCFPP